MNKSKDFAVGDRVNISSAHSWAGGISGVISTPSVNFEDEETILPFRDIRTPHGTKRLYWVTFDSPCYDADGDGPYSEAEIDSKYLEVVNE
jgi:hypothetical protein